jgi:RNA polymerase primary sigma factor
MYLREIGKYPLLNAQKSATWPSASPRATTRRATLLARANLRLVVSIAKKYVGRSPTLRCLTLSKRATSGSLRPSTNLTTQRALNSHLCHLVDPPGYYPRAWPTRAALSASPCTWSRLSPNTSRCRRRLAQDLGRDPLGRRDSSEMGVDVEKVYQIEKIDQDTVSLESPVGSTTATASRCSATL